MPKGQQYTYFTTEHQTYAVQTCNAIKRIFPKDFIPCIVRESNGTYFLYDEHDLPRTGNYAYEVLCYGRLLKPFAFTQAELKILTNVLEHVDLLFEDRVIIHDCKAQLEERRKNAP